MVSLYRTFAQALHWNTLECVIYQGLFLAHQIAFFSHASAPLYGLVGILFSLVYLMVYFGNCGLDASLAPFFHQSSADKHSFKAIVVPQLAVNALLYSAALSIIYIVKTLLLPISISPLLYCILSLLVLSESTKKTIRTLLHLAFLNKTTTVIEILSISSYTGLVWLIYYLQGGFTVYTLFVPMLLVSCSVTTALALVLYRWYSSLPDAASVHTQVPLKRLLKSRLFTSVHTLGHIVFSSNFIVPLCAARFGLEHAGVLKFISTIAYTVAAIVHRIFGFSLDALFIRITNTNNNASEKEAFSLATEKLHHVLYAVLLFLCINHHKIIGLRAQESSFLTTSSAFVFLILMLSEHLFTVYEKFYISKERADVLVFLHSIVTASAYMIITFTQWSSLTYMLSVIVVIRLAACALLAALSFYQWRIVPSFRLNPTYVAAALSFALLFFICV